MTPATRVSVDIARARREELDRLARRHGGLTPSLVVAFAENPETALHSLFTWDDTEAARKWREEEAARYIRAVVRVIPTGHGDEPVRVRAFFSLPSQRGNGFYRATTDILDSPELREELVHTAMKEYKDFRDRYKHLAELAQFFAAADAAALAVSGAA